MKSSKVKEIVAVCSLVVLVVALIGSVSLISKNVFYALKPERNSYVLRDILSYDLPVISEVEAKIGKPFNDESVNIQVNFYSYADDSERQEKSLILYDNTYMPSTGILYSSEKAFDVLAVADGKVENIEEHEVFGTIITIKHNNNLITRYSSIKEAKVQIGDTVNAGEIIGVSSINKVTSVSENMLLFEMIYDGKYVNPENYYDKVIEEMN